MVANSFLVRTVAYCVIIHFGRAENDVYKNQYCTDPRTMRKHQAYTEWADAYSCTRHRCQPGGRNLAIYTVGCKRVEAPESAIECEEVVEDTNMQFPYCCTRLRCLVVVRGEVWTRVLGQPWETLPAAPWSHMYKMKKPPPEAGVFPGDKHAASGPVYELAEAGDRDGNERASLRTKRGTTTAPPCDDPPDQPDIVIALETDDPKESSKRKEERKRIKMRSTKKKVQPGYSAETAEEKYKEKIEVELDDQEKVVDRATNFQAPGPDLSEENFYAKVYGVTQRSLIKPTTPDKIVWTDAPYHHWEEPRTEMTLYVPPPLMHRDRDLFESHEDQKPKKADSNLKDLVAAIGTRMRDIETVVQRMSEKVVEKNKEKKETPRVAEFESAEKASQKSEPLPDRATKDDYGKPKQPNTDADYKRFTVHGRGSKYVRIQESSTTEFPLFVEDSNLNGYFSDSAKPVRRSNSHKEPIQPGYMAPVEPRRSITDGVEKKQRKKHGKKKRPRHHRAHKKKQKSLSAETKRRRFNRVNSVEMERNVVSLEDSSGIASMG